MTSLNLIMLRLRRFPLRSMKSHQNEPRSLPAAVALCFVPTGLKEGLP